MCVGTNSRPLRVHLRHENQAGGHFDTRRPEPVRSSELSLTRCREVLDQLRLAHGELETFRKAMNVQDVEFETDERSREGKVPPQHWIEQYGNPRPDHRGARR